MNPVLAWWQATGFATPGPADLVQLAAAGGVVLVALAIGVLAGRRTGPRLATWWRTHVAGHGEGVWTRLSAIVRHAVAALVLAIALGLWPWPPLAALPLGFTLGVAAGLTAHQVLRGLGLPRWSAWAIAAILFVALFSQSVGGLAAITAALERIGVGVGRRRLSLLTLVTMLVTVIALYALIRFVNRVAAHSIARAKGLDATQKLLAQKLVGIVVVVVVFFFGIDLLGLDLTSFAVFSGAFGLAIGFGLQKTVGNLIAGIILLMDRSIKPGDVIVVGEEAGRVNKIGVRAVSVVTRDGKEHLIPNENLMTQEVENWSYSDRNVRVRIKVGVPYDCDLRVAQALMLQAASDSPRVLDSPKPNVWLTSYGDYAVEHEILAWISDPEGGVGNVRSDVLNRLWWLLKDAGIAIPVPQRDIRILPAGPTGS
ncbi:mechanosensitive ion channel family protein [Sphingomonas rubra]|uniref:Mechanosensitive ion channel n=1 Tax=Sphingomonas rubra TaxID=634430 RepID=A0A1I5U1X0_9SPHN|nr:mechanosensitive ion channel domain-containing protein [Sphingomonas rubra]SFP89312.1 Mechanosensitive ion channel [Sphingomonas rubra]